MYEKGEEMMKSQRRKGAKNQPPFPTLIWLQRGFSRDNQNNFEVKTGEGVAASPTISEDEFHFSHESST